MNLFVLWFTKITGLIPQYFYYHKKVYYENKTNQSRHISGGALIVSNHFSIYDFPLVMFTFLRRSVYVLIAEVTMNKNFFMKRFTKHLGGICVDRGSFDFSFMSRVGDKLKNNKVVLIYPEARMKTNEEIKKNELITFKPSFVYIALENNVPIIPVCTNGKYGIKNFFSRKRARIMIGEKIILNEMYDEKKSEKDNVEFLCEYVKKRISKMKKELDKIDAENEK